MLPTLKLLCIAEDEEEEGGEGEREEEDDDEEEEAAEEDEEEEGRPTMLGVHEFINLRQDYGRPVTLVETKAEFEEKLKSYQ